MKYRPTPHFLAALAVLLTLVSFGALADDNLSWAHPTQRVDGAPLALSEIRGTVIRWRASPTATIILGSTEVPAPATSHVNPRDPLVAGTLCYSAATVDTDGAQSSFTEDVCKTIAKSKPRRPQNLVVQ